MKVWILQTGEPLQIDKGNPRPMRAINLSNKLVEAGHDVVLWSSSFDHQNKRHRSKVNKVFNVNDQLKINLIHSCGYKAHIGIGRLIDHFHMAFNLKKWLMKESNLPDVVFIGYPPIETAFVMSNWLKIRGVPVLLDVKDLWPSIFIDAFPKTLKPLAKVIFYPYFLMARKTMRDSNGISTMSKGFLNWSLDFSKRPACSYDKIVRLTSIDGEFESEDIKKSQEWWNNIGVYQKTIKVFFVGTFSTAFDFEQIYFAALKIKHCQFVLCGHGPCFDEIKKKMKGLDNVVFPGWIDRIKMKSLADMSIASLAPYKNVENFRLNIPNKIIDSLLLGIPILSPLGGEVQLLLKENNVGFTYDDNYTLTHFILKLIDNSKLQLDLSINSKKLYDSEFQFNKVYNSLVIHLENMSQKRSH